MHTPKVMRVFGIWNNWKIWKHEIRNIHFLQIWWRCWTMDGGEKSNHFFYFDITTYILKSCKKDRTACHFVIGELDIANLHCSCTSEFAKLGLSKLPITRPIRHLILNFTDKCWFFCGALHDYDTLIHFLAVRYRLRPWSVGSKPL